MGEVRRYANLRAYMTVQERADGEYVLHSDYVSLERERDELAEQLATLQTDAFDERQDERAELTRLRAVEAAAVILLDGACEIEIGRNTITEVGKADLRALAEACGRKAP